MHQCYNPGLESLVIDTPNIGVSANVTLEEDTETCAGDQLNVTNSIMTYQHYWQCTHAKFLKEEDTTKKSLQARQTPQILGAKQKHLFSDTSEQNSCSRESQEDQNEGDRLKEKEASAREREEHESEVLYISEKSLRTTEPKTNGYRLAKIRRNYTFKQSIENLHMGRPAYCSVDFNPCERTRCLMRVEVTSSGTRELYLPAGKSRRGGGSPQSRGQFKTEREPFGPGEVTDVVKGHS